MFCNTLTPLVSRGNNLSFANVKTIAASFKPVPSKSLEEHWVRTAQEQLKWPEATSKIVMNYFQMFNQAVSTGDASASDKTGQIFRFLTFLYVQIYLQGETNRESQNNLAQERACPSPEDKTPPSSPRRIVNAGALLSPTTAKSAAVAFDERSVAEQIAFLKQHMGKIFAVLQEFVTLTQKTSKYFFVALEIIVDTVGRESVSEALDGVYDDSASEPAKALTAAILALFKVTEDHKYSNTKLNKDQKIYGIHRSTKVHVLDVPASGHKATLPDLKIAHCSNATIYMLQPFRFCRISSCADCTIVVGAVSSLVSIENCERVKIVACSMYARVNNCLDCTFNIFTTNRPLLLGDNRGLVFGPYNTNYGMLEEHLKCANLREDTGIVNPGCWNSPLDINIAEGESSAFSLIRAEDFFPFSVPIKDGADGNQKRAANGIPLPSNFPAAIEKKMSNVNAIREMIKHPANEQENSANNGTIIEGGDIMIEQIVQKKFRDWLVNSGNVREIADLICLEKACKGDS